MEKSEVHAVELVRKIRDEQAALLANKSEEEVLAFFRAAGQRARKGAEEHQKSKGTREEGA
jgi:hypothetical protein